MADQIEHCIEWQVESLLEIGDSAKYQRATQARVPGAQFILAEPVGRDDIGIQRRFVYLVQGLAPEIHAQDRSVAGRIGTPQVKCDDAMRLESVAGFFQGFPDDGIDQTLARFEMPGWLIEYGVFASCFLDDQKPPLVRHDGGDGDMGFPNFGRVAFRLAHAGKFTSKTRRAIAPHPRPFNAEESEVPWVLPLSRPMVGCAPNGPKRRFRDRQ